MGADRRGPWGPPTRASILLLLKTWRKRTCALPQLSPPHSASWGLPIQFANLHDEVITSGRANCGSAAQLNKPLARSLGVPLGTRLALTPRGQGQCPVGSRTLEATRAPSWASRPSPGCPFKPSKHATARTAPSPAAHPTAHAAASGPPLPPAPQRGGASRPPEKPGPGRRAVRVIGQREPDAGSRYKSPEAAACATVFARSCRGFLLQQCLDGTRRSFLHPAGLSALPSATSPQRPPAAPIRLPPPLQRRRAAAASP